MVAVLVRLKVALLLNELRRSVWQAVGFALAALWALSVVGLVLAAAVGASFADPDPDLAATVSVLVGAMVVLGWWVVPVLAQGLDSTLDPRRFQPLGVDPDRRGLVLGLAVTSVVGIPGITTGLCAVAAAFAWWRAPVALVAGLVGAALGIAVCVVGARAIVAVLSPLSERRRFREVVTALALVPIVLLPLIGQLVDSVTTSSGLDAVARVVGWTPLGAPWALAPDVADGAWAAAAGRLVVCAAALAAGLWVWSTSLRRALVSPPPRPPAGRTHGYGWFDRTRPGPAGAIAARCLTYWQRDPRYAGSLLYLPFLPVPFLVIGGLDSSSLLLLAPLGAFVMGFTISADLSYDSTAWWTHVAAGVDGVADRVGRVRAVAVQASVVVLVFAIGSVAVTGRWEMLAAVLGLSAGILLVTLGCSSLLAARFVYPVPLPGHSMFATPRGGSTSVLVAQFVGLVATTVLALPAIVAFVSAWVLGGVVASALTVGVGLAVGSVVLVAGIRLGGAYLDRAGADVLTRLAAQG